MHINIIIYIIIWNLLPWRYLPPAAVDTLDLEATWISFAYSCKLIILILYLYIFIQVFVECLLRFIVYGNLKINQSWYCPSRDSRVIRIKEEVSKYFCFIQLKQRRHEKVLMLKSLWKIRGGKLLIYVEGCLGDFRWGGNFGASSRNMSKNFKSRL